MNQITNRFLMPLAGLVMVTWCLAGCATILNGTSDRVHISSIPHGATVTTEGGQTYTTPASIRLTKSKSSQVLTVTKKGYQPRTQVIERTGNGWWLLNFLLGPSLLGVFIDVASGGTYDLEPRNVVIPLDKEE